MGTKPMEIPDSVYKSICVCGHSRKLHEEEPPYECCELERGTTFRCDCGGFEYRQRPSADAQHAGERGIEDANCKG